MNKTLRRARVALAVFGLAAAASLSLTSSASALVVKPTVGKTVAPTVTPGSSTNAPSPTTTTTTSSPVAPPPVVVGGNPPTQPPAGN